MHLRSSVLLSCICFALAYSWKRNEIGPGGDDSFDMVPELRKTTNNSNLFSVQDLKIPGTGSAAEAVSIDKDDTGNYYVLVQSLAQSNNAVPTYLCKTSPDFKILWTKRMEKITGTAYQIVVDSKAGEAVVASASATLQNRAVYGVVALIRGISGANQQSADKEVSHSILHAVSDSDGIAKLFACAIDSANGDIYAAGGFKSSTSNEQHGSSDLVVLRISRSQNKTLIGRGQVPSKLHESGIALIRRNGSQELLVAARRDDVDAGTKMSLLYSFKTPDLKQWRILSEASRSLPSPYFEPKAMTLADVGSPSSGYVSFVCGKTRVAEIRKSDAFVKMYSVIDGEATDFPFIDIDGHEDKGLANDATGIQMGNDGNVYMIGNSVNGTSRISKVFVGVLDPTGNELDRVGMPLTGGESYRASAMVIPKSGAHVVFVGWRTTSGNNTRIPIIGRLELSSRGIPLFTGFARSPKQSASPKEIEARNEETSDPNNINITQVMTIAAIVGGLAALIALPICAWKIRKARRERAERKLAMQGDELSPRGQHEISITFQDS